MRRLNDLIREVRQLSPQDRQRLLETLEESLVDGEKSGDNAAPNHPYANTLRLAGTFHSEFEDVSSEKYKPLAGAPGPLPGTMKSVFVDSGLLRSPDRRRPLPLSRSGALPTSRPVLR